MKSVARLVRLGKRGVAVALLAVFVAAAALPASASAGGLPHIVHVSDGQGDSPLVP
jgi:hypothetical protein